MAASAAAGAGGIASRQCAHCRLPLPAHPHAQSEGEKTLLFCCAGCLLVFRVIGKAGEGGRADWLLAKLGLAALLSGNVMMFQSLNYFGTLEQLGADAARTSSWIMFGCSLAVYALLGVPMLRIAVRDLLKGRLRLETLIGFGTLAAIGCSAAETLRGGNHLYYDSGTMVLVFVTLGQYLDAEARRRALVLLSPALGRVRRLARLVRGGEELSVVPDEVRAGEIVLVRAGEEIPVDGTVLEGAADVHEPMLTGEWQPRLVAEGDVVSAGSTAVDGAIRVRASGLAETLVERVERYAIEARDRRAPIEATVDRVTAGFIPVVMLIAIASCCLWGLAGQWDRGFLAALAVLVVACPCALGIATPMATTIALTRAIGRGSLVRSGAALEVLSRVRAVAFDKTGTLTAGRPRVGAFCSATDASAGPDECLLLAASVEREVSHPFARAIVESVLARGWTLPAATGVSMTPGGGAHGFVYGRHVAVGKRSWLAARGVAMVAEPATETAASTVAIAVDGRLAGELSLDDPPRPEARDSLSALRRMGLSCQLLSGDREAGVARVAVAIGGLDYRADLSPTDKPDALRALRAAQGLVAMVGDGVNDAPALGSADVGIAFGPAADVARETADVTILREDLYEVPRLLELARATFRIVRQNLAWAFTYNSIAVLIAAFGLLRPVFAAAAMVLSSLCVVGNSMRLGRMALGPPCATL
jgi:Cu2+-exporting ATPase